MAIPSTCMETVGMSDCVDASDKTGSTKESHKDDADASYQGEMRLLEKGSRKHDAITAGASCEGEAETSPGDDTATLRASCEGEAEIAGKGKSQT